MVFRAFLQTFCVYHTVFREIKAMQESGLQAFVVKSKATASEGFKNYKIVHVVLGNESCDLDSAVSALVTGYWLWKKQLPDTAVVPLLNIPRKDASLRTEVIYYLDYCAGIQISQLICKDEVNLSTLAKESLRITLVDHNMLAKDDSHLSAYVVDVIDHHKIESQYSATSTIETVGSCSTLVAEKILNDMPQIVTPDVAALLYGTILLDTAGLNVSAKRATPKDINIINQLESLLEKPVNRNEIFEKLYHAKSDITKMSAEDILRKDAKYLHIPEGDSVAISSVPAKLEKVLPLINPMWKSFCSSNNCASLIIMTFSQDSSSNQITREVAIFSEKVQLRNALIKVIEKDVSPLVPIDLTLKLDCGEAFIQSDVTASRKQLLPAVLQHLKEA